MIRITTPREAGSYGERSRVLRVLDISTNENTSSTQITAPRSSNAPIHRLFQRIRERRSRERNLRRRDRKSPLQAKGRVYVDRRLHVRRRHRGTLSHKLAVFEQRRQDRDLPRLNSRTIPYQAAKGRKRAFR